MYTLYGIPNCDTVKKAKKKLDELGLEYDFVNFKKEVPSPALLKKWKKSFDDQWPLNKKGRTYKQLSNQIESIKDSEMPKFIAENTSLIKRPVLEKAGNVICFGYDEESFSSLN